MKRKALILGLLIAFVIPCVSLFATGQPNTTAPAAASGGMFTTDNITLTQWTFLNPEDSTGRGKVIGDLIDQFEGEHPNVRIVTEVQQWTELLPKQMAAFYAGNEPDIMWNAAEYISGIVAIGAYEPFENLFLSEWTQDEIDDVADLLWGTGTTDGKHYFFDITRSPFGIAYRADFFEKYGLSNNPSDYPDLTDFLEALMKFNGAVENGVEVYGFGTGYNPSAPATGWLSIGLGAAGELYNPDGTADFATPTGVKLMELQKAMIDDMKITPASSLAEDYEDNYNDFDAGKYAAITTSSARVSRIRTNATFDPLAIQVMAYPDIYGNPAKALSGGWCIGVSSHSDYKYEAGKFVELLGSRQADWAFTNEAGQVAVRKSTYLEHPDFFQQPQYAYITALKEIMENNIYPIPPFPAIGTKEDLLIAFSNYYLEGMTAMEALQKAEADFNERNAD